MLIERETGIASVPREAWRGCVTLAKGEAHPTARLAQASRDGALQREAIALTCVSTASAIA
jgi:hypothetical protein